MFRNIMEMIGKLKQNQQKVEETKKHLDFIIFDEKCMDLFK
jgi:hypothetical protein